MGTMISLGVGKLEIAWGKNGFFDYYCDLFQPEDLKKIKYFYAGGVVETKKGYSRSLSLVKPRLDLLGYTLQNVRSLYDDAYDDYCERMGTYAEKLLTFDEYYSIFSKIDLSKVNTLTEDDDWNFGEFVPKCIFEDEEIQRLLKKYSDGRGGEFYENLDARLLVRVLCENPTAVDVPLQWYIADHIESGWSTEEELAPRLEEKDKILVVTEGKSDTFVLQTTINMLFPEIADFFNFIDMEENYPFTGTGNLYNFASGLTKIKIQNQTMVIFDNDEAGIFSYNKCKEKLDVIPNLKFYHLPDMAEFENFLTVGPTGESYQDINGKAVSIECFMDLHFNLPNPPKVRWTIYSEKSDRYQGALISKDEYTRIFKKHLGDEGYRNDKLLFLINDLINFWCNG